MTVAKQKYIFGLEGSTHSTFKIYPTEASGGKLRDWIELAGGTCLGPDEDGPFAIPILDLAWCKTEEIEGFRKCNARDVFKSLFIYDCYTKEKLMDLNSYKIGHTTLSEYDANLILQRRLSWDDVKISSSAVVEDEEENDSNMKSMQRHSRKRHLSSSKAVGARKKGVYKSDEQLEQKANVNARDKSNERLCNDYVPVPINKVKLKSTATQYRLTSHRQSCKKNVERVVEWTVQSHDRHTNRVLLRSSCSSNNQNLRESSIESINLSSADKSVADLPPPTTNSPSLPPVNGTSTRAPSPNSRPSRPELRMNGNQRLRSRGTSTDSSICSIHFSDGSNTRKRRKGAPYEYEESLKLLKYICDHDKHFLTGGNQMWIEMEELGILEDRTHQSLKEHFRRIISKDFDFYKCSEIDKRKFEKAKKVRDAGRRHPQRMGWWSL